VIRVGFAGSSAFGAACLERLLAIGIDVAVVLSQPDRPAGRRRRPTPTPVSELAQAEGLPLLRPERAEEAVPALREASVERMAICAYGQLLRQPVLDALPWVNLHPSALPRWRGAAPVERAILAGDDTGGVSVMAVVLALDAGPTAAVERFPIGPRDDAGVVMGRALELGVPRLAEALTGSPDLTPQAADDVTYAHKLEAADRLLDPFEPVDLADRRVRALSPHIGAALHLGGERFLIWEAVPVEAGPPPGRVEADGGRILCGFAGGALDVQRLQAPGRRPMTAAELLRGWRAPLEPATRGA
jgi:methionyl-tRNA formyltransferase